MTPRVAFAGFGNAGKSSLFNAIYGEDKSSVSMRTDETRESLTESRFGIDFTDTPGFGTGAFSLEQVRAMGVFDEQHVVVHVLNAATAISEEDQKLQSLIEESKARRVTVVNKVDLLDERERAEFAESMKEKLGLSEQDYLFISAKSDINIDRLVEQITKVLPKAMQDAFIAQQQGTRRLKELRVRKLISSTATACAGIALTPLPIADMAVLTPTQMGMVAAIGRFHGIHVTTGRALELIGVLGAGFGLREAARQLIKLVPGVGSVVSAGIAFAGTVALGEVANLWFRNQMDVPAEQLRDVFQRTAERARSEFGTHRQRAEDARARIEEFEQQRADGTITASEYGENLRKVVDDREED